MPATAFVSQHSFLTATQTSIHKRPPQFTENAERASDANILSTTIELFDWRTQQLSVRYALIPKLIHKLIW